MPERLDGPRAPLGVPSRRRVSSSAGRSANDAAPAMLLVDVRRPSRHLHEPRRRPRARPPTSTASRAADGGAQAPHSGDRRFVGDDRRGLRDLGCSAASGVEKPSSARLDGQRSLSDAVLAARAAGDRRRGGRARSAGAGTAPSPARHELHRGRARSSPGRPAASGRAAARAAARACRRRCPAGCRARPRRRSPSCARRPAAATSSSSVRGTSPSNSSSSIAHRPAQRLRLLAEEAGREDVALELLLRHGEVVLRAAGTSGTALA